MNRDTTNLTRYVESASIDYRLLKKADSHELKESIQKCHLRLRESIDSSNGWWVPISFYNKKNSNGRIYNRQLWENVINDQRDVWVGAPMLADHPQGDSDGTPLNICGVWIDARIDAPDYKNEGLVYGLLVPSGHIGEDLKDHLSNGLKVGTSSSGFGKLLSDGVTVDPNSFVIERLSDWVLNPSQGTFFSYEESDEEDTIKNRCKESVSTVVERNDYNYRENIVKDSKIAKLEEKKFRRDMESFLESASNIKDPQERLQEFKEIKSYLEDGACPDLKEKIEQKIQEEEEFIRIALKEKIELKEEFQIESTRDLKEKLTKIVEDSALLNKEVQDWKQISEKLQSKLEEATKELDSRPTETYVQFLKEKHESAANLNGKLNQMLDTLKESYTNSLADLREELCESREQLETAKNNCSTLSKKSKAERLSSQKVISDKEVMLDESSSRINELMGVISALHKKNDELTKTVESCKAQNKNLKESLKTASKLLKETKKFTESKEVEHQAVVKELNDLKAAQARELREARRVRTAEFKETRLSDTDRYFNSLRKEYGSSIDQFEEKLRSAVNMTEAKRVFYSEVLPRLQKNSEVSDSLVGRDSLKESALKGEKSFDVILKNLPEGWF